MAEGKRAKTAKKVALYGIATAVGTFIAPVIGECIADVFASSHNKNESNATDDTSAEDEVTATAE